MRILPGGLGVVLAIGLLWVACASAAAATSPPVLSEFCDGPPPASDPQCKIPRGVAVDPASGEVYVVDSFEERIDEFTIWGEFVRAWGWGVANGSPELQTCFTNCRSGTAGSESGQFQVEGQGITVDGAGNVYVVDKNNRRVQKFEVPADPKAPVQFALMFGGKVNKTKAEAVAPEEDQNRCPVDPGDVCQAGVEGTGDGQFGAWRVGSYIGTSPDGETIYVGDQGRIQEFDTEGRYVGDLPDPSHVLEAEGTVNSLAVDPASGALYVGFFRANAPPPQSKPDLHKLSSAGEELCTIEAHNPRAVAVGPGGEVYLVDGPNGEAPREVLRLGSECGSKDRELLFRPERTSTAGENQFTTDPTGIAASTACEVEGVDLFFANPDSTDGFVRSYGPPPDPEVCPPPVVPPSVEDQYASAVGSEGASLQAAINPHFWLDTRYYVEYGTGNCAAGGCGQSQPLPPGSLLTEAAAGAAVKTAPVSLSGLQPATTYNFRFVAESSGGGPVFGVGATEEAPQGGEGTFSTYPPQPQPKTGCPNQPFRGGLSSPLPDCRAYEMVSPLDKNNGDITDDDAFLNHPSNLQLPSSDGNRVTYSSYTSFGAPEGAAFLSQYLSSRDPARGWSTHSISPPRSSVPVYVIDSHANATQFKAFSPDLCEGWFIQDSDLDEPPLGAPAGVASIYRRDDGECGEAGYKLITTAPPPGFPTTEEIEEANINYYPMVQGISANGRETLLRADAPLTPDACTTTPGTEESKGIFQLYLQDGAGQLHLVSVLPNGDPACVHSSAGTGQGSAGESREDSVYHALADNGLRVYWSTNGDSSSNQTPFTGGDEDQAGPLYLRVNPAEAQSTLSGGKCSQPENACTYPVSGLVGGGRARFLAANPDGSRALFSLDPDEGGPAPTNLYEFTVGEGAPLETEATLLAEGFNGLMGASSDLRRIYFTSSKALGGGKNSEGAEAVEGKPNLYLREAGSLVFVATLSSLDAVNGASTNAPPSPIATVPSRRSSRVSTDGLHAAFASTAQLTGYPNADAKSGEPDSEVYLYDAEPGGAGKLRCVSCNPAGARPAGRFITGTNGGVQLWAAGSLPGWQLQFSPTRLLSDDGDQLFFESYEPLVLRDTNGRRDVYEWERGSGEEDCIKDKGAELYVASAGGCLSLISAGKGALNSQLIGISDSGSDAFFFTATSLLPQDPGLIDVYDARVDGGFPAPQPAEPPCEGEACQPSPPPPENRTPSSASFEGRGNVEPAPRCAGSARRAKRLSRRARHLRHAARHAADPRAAHGKTVSAHRLAAKAKRLARGAKRCRKRARRTGR